MVHKLQNGRYTFSDETDNYFGIEYETEYLAEQGLKDYQLYLEDNNTSKPNSGMFESCVICHVVTTILKSTHIDMRLNYVDGVGQLCRSCAAAG